MRIHASHLRLEEQEQEQGPPAGLPIERRMEWVESRDISHQSSRCSQIFNPQTDFVLGSFSSRCRAPDDDGDNLLRIFSVIEAVSIRGHRSVVGMVELDFDLFAKQVYRVLNSKQRARFVTAATTTFPDCFELTSWTNKPWEYMLAGTAHDRQNITQRIKRKSYK